MKSSQTYHTSIADTLHWLGRLFLTYIDNNIILCFFQLTFCIFAFLRKQYKSVPFTPNIAKISERIRVPRNSILKILDLLAHARIISLLKRETKGMSYLQKPEKIYLQNTNLAWLLSENKPDTGNLRETFFYNQIEVRHRVTSSRFGDFTIDDAITFEIGGPSKTAEQIKGIPNAYIAADGIKGGTGNKIPLWLFGFLY
jgi:hypothetical protein